MHVALIIEFILHSFAIKCELTNSPRQVFIKSYWIQNDVTEENSWNGSSVHVFSHTRLVKLPDFTALSGESIQRAGHSLIDIHRHEKGPAEPSEGGVSWHPIKTHQFPLFSSHSHLRHSGQRHQEETWFNRPSDPCVFVTYCCGMSLRAGWTSRQQIIQQTYWTIWSNLKPDIQILYSSQNENVLLQTI